MNNPKTAFNSRDEVVRWVDGCIAHGMSTQLIHALINKKTKDLSQRKDYFIMKRRQAIVSGNMRLASEFGTIMKSCEAQLTWFSEVTRTPVPTNSEQERYMDPETKLQLLYKMPQFMN